MGFKLTATDRKMLEGVHPDLVKVVLRAATICTHRFKVLEGLRTLARQKQLKAIGASKTLNSRHLDGHAVDLVPMVDLDKDGKISSKEMFHWPLYDAVKVAMKRAAKELGVPLEWGGDWKSLKDGPHWQLPFAAYPKKRTVATYEADREPATDYETASGAATKSVSAGVGSVAVAAPIASEPLANAIDGITQQQYELASGDIARIVLALVIVGLGVWFAWSKARGPA